MLYNSPSYQNRAVKFNDYVNNKYDIVHQKLYQDALSKYLLEFVDNSISGKFMHRLFELITKYFNLHQNIDLDKLLDYDKFNDLDASIILMNNVDKYIKENDSEQNNDNIINELITTINNDELVQNTFNKLQITHNGNIYSYIKYLFINIMFILYKLKSALISSRLSEIINIINISDFIINYNNVIYIIDENNEILTLIENEDMYDDIIFIEEFMHKDNIHIGYNENGKWIIDIDNTYNITDIYGVLYELITKTNYNIWNIFIDNIKDMFLSSHRIIEMKNVEYWQPSSILIISNIAKTKKRVDLTPYWNDYQAYNNLQIDKLMATLDDELIDGKITHIDYVRGNAKIHSRHFDKTVTVDLNYIHKDSEIDDEATLANTFTYKFKYDN